MESVHGIVHDHQQWPLIKGFRYYNMQKYNFVMRARGTFHRNPLFAQTLSLNVNPGFMKPL